MKSRNAVVAGIACMPCFAHVAAGAEIVFEAINDNGYFTPFNADNAGTVLYGDGGWLSRPDSPPVALGRILLGLAVFDGPKPGTTDIRFTFSDGDPSGLVFGSGATLYETTIRNVPLPATEPGQAAFFTLEIPLPGVMTSGGFNDVGWSIGLDNFDYAGEFGMQVSSCFGQFAGFYTNNASFYDGASWSLFSFGSDLCFGIANFVATIETATPLCVGDLTGDFNVGADDLAILLGAWGGEGSQADLDGSGEVDAADLTLLLGAWGPCPVP